MKPASGRKPGLDAGRPHCFTMFTYAKVVRLGSLASGFTASPQSKTYPGQATNNCNGAFQADPTG